MSKRPPASAAILALLAVALILPVALVVLLGVGALLGAMGDAVGSRVLGWIGLALGVVWLVDLVCLVLLQALGSLVEPNGDDRESGSEP